MVVANQTADWDNAAAITRPGVSVIGDVLAELLARYGIAGGPTPRPTHEGPSEATVESTERAEAACQKCAEWAECL
jgi:hypothetical protein